MAERSFEEQVIALEELAARLKHDVQTDEKCWKSPAGYGDQVSGIQVVGPGGEIKQEWSK